MLMFRSTHRMIVTGYEIETNALRTMRDDARSTSRTLGSALNEVQNERDEALAALNEALAERDAARATLAEIAAMETPSCASIGRRMARVARGEGV